MLVDMKMGKYLSGSRYLLTMLSLFPTALSFAPTLPVNVPATQARVIEPTMSFGKAELIGANGMLALPLMATASSLSTLVHPFHSLFWFLCAYSLPEYVNDYMMVHTFV